MIERSGGAGSQPDSGRAQPEIPRSIGGKNAEPAFTDNGLTLSASEELSGLGNGDVLVSLAATADVTATCTNPAGATQPPGQNPAPITVTGSRAIPQDEIKNGTTPFSVITTAPVSDRRCS